MQAPGCVRCPLRQRTSARGDKSCLHSNESLVQGHASPSRSPTSLTKTSLRPLSSSSLTASEGDLDNCADQGGIVQGIDRLLRTSSISGRSDAFTGPDDRPLGVEVAIHEYRRGEYSTHSMDPTFTPLPLHPQASSKADALRPSENGLPERDASQRGHKSEQISSQPVKVEYTTGPVQQEQDGCISSQPSSMAAKESRQGLLLEQTHSTFLDLASADSLAHGPFLMERNNVRETTCPALGPGEGISPQRPLPPDWIEMLRAAIPQAHHLEETGPSNEAHIHPALRQAACIPEHCTQADPFGSGNTHGWDAHHSPRFPPVAASSPPTPRHVKQPSRQSIVSSSRSPSASLLRRRHSLFTSTSAYEQERDGHPSQHAVKSVVTEREAHQVSGRKDGDSVEGASSNLGSFSSISSFLAYNSFSSQPLRSSSTTVPSSSISSFSTDHLYKQQSMDNSANSSRIGRVVAQPDPYLQKATERRSSLQLNSLSLPDTSRSFDHARKKASLEAAIESAVLCSPDTRPLTSMQEESPSVTSLDLSGHPRSRQKKSRQDGVRNTNLATKDETYRRAQSLLFAQRPAAKRGPSSSGSKDYASRRSSDYGSRQHSSNKVSCSLGDGHPADRTESDSMKQDRDHKLATGSRKRVSGVGSDMKRGLKRLLG